MRELPGGLVLRTATASDVAGIVELGVESHGRAQEWGIRTLLSGPDLGPERFTVVCDGDRIVSSLCLMAHRFRFGGVELAVGRPEFVATVPDHRRHGLVRAQLDVVHEWSAARGDLLQLITGINYFYRRFGYEYALDYLHYFCLKPGLQVPAPARWLVLPARAADLDDLRRLLQSAISPAELVADRDAVDWERLLDDDPSNPLRMWVAVQRGAVHGMAAVLMEGDDGPVRMADVAADTCDAVAALVAHGAAGAGARPFWIADRPGTPVSAFLADRGVPARKPIGVYARVPDPVALLDRLRPVLSDRLVESPHAGDQGELLVSLYNQGIRLSYEPGKVTAVEWAPGVEDPEDEGVVGVPPDLVATLLLGRYGALELERRHDDVTLGNSRTLMATLFPRVRAEVLVMP
jgi:hypothetical protein